MNLTHELLERLATEYGDDVLLLDLDQFRANLESFRAAFRAGYPRVELAFSYKTNYIPAVIRAVDEWGGYAEVVSRMEHDMARRIGVAPSRVIVNGPYRSAQDLEQALAEGALVNLDSPYQLDLLQSVADGFDAAPRVGLRCTFDVPGTRPSRFGFDADADALHDAVRRVRDLGIEPTSLHCHFSSDRRAETYRRIAERMVELVNEHFSSPPEIVDIGGGYFSPMPSALQAQFDRAIPSYEDYAEATTVPFTDAYPQDGPTLFVEPGVAVSANTMRYAARVIDRTEIGQRRFALVAGSIHVIKPTLNTLDLPCTVVTPDGPRDGTAVEVVGYTCMEHDVLHSSLAGDPRPGDFVVFDNVGAYTVVMKPPFIRPAPPIVVVGDEPQLARRRETLDDVLATYV